MQFVRQLGVFCVIIDIKLNVYLTTKLFITFEKNVMMFGDLVRFELFVGLTTSFDPLFANFKLEKRLWEG